MCPTEHCTTGETPRARTRAKVVISCSTFSNADHCYCLPIYISFCSDFSPFLTISLCRADRCLSHPIFSIVCHVFSQLVFLLVSFMLSLDIFFGRPLILLPETSSLSDFAPMWLGSRLKQWLNHFSLLFSRKMSTCFILCTPPSRCLHF